MGIKFSLDNRYRCARSAPHLLGYYTPTWLYTVVESKSDEEAGRLTAWLYSSIWLYAQIILLLLISTLFSQSNFRRFNLDPSIIKWGMLFTCPFPNAWLWYYLGALFWNPAFLIIRMSERTQLPTPHPLNFIIRNVYLTKVINSGPLERVAFSGHGDHLLSSEIIKSRSLKKRLRILYSGHFL